MHFPNTTFEVTSDLRFRRLKGEYCLGGAMQVGGMWSRSVSVKAIYRKI